MKKTTSKVTFQIGTKIGDNGPDIEQLQKYLVQSGFLYTDSNKDPYSNTLLWGMPLTEKMGQFGESTALALQAYQFRQNLNPTGVLDPPTISSLQTPRCGCPDTVRQLLLNRRAPVTNTQDTQLEFGYKFNNSHPLLSPQFCLDSANYCGQQWASVTPLYFYYAEGIEEHPAIEIMFARFIHEPDVFNPFDGPSGVLAHTYMPDIGGRLASDMHFDADESWSETGVLGIDFQTVYLHELGHAIGLGHSKNPDSVMFPNYSGVRRTLSPDDLAHVQALYGPYADYDTLRIRKIGPDPTLRDQSAFWIEGTQGQDLWFIFNGAYVNTSNSGFSNADSVIAYKRPGSLADDVVRHGDSLWLRTSKGNMWWYNDRAFLITDPREQYRHEYMIMKVTPQDPSDPHTFDDVIRDGDYVRIRNLTAADHAAGDEWIVCIRAGELVRARSPNNPPPNLSSD